MGSRGHARSLFGITGPSRFWPTTGTRLTVYSGVAESAKAAGRKDDALRFLRLALTAGTGGAHAAAGSNGDLAALFQA